MFGRRRRKNADTARSKRYSVYVTPEEDAQLRARAVVLGVTVPRLLVESAMDANVETDTHRKAAIAEIFAVRRLMATVSNNMNQLARFANTQGRFPAEAASVLAEYRRLVPRMERAAERLGGL